MEVLREEVGLSFGVESAGPRQVRGNGNLALTHDELVFAQWVPNRTLHIPRSSILEITTTRAHLGKTIGSKLLKIVWTNEVGERDSVAI